MKTLENGPAFFLSQSGSRGRGNIFSLGVTSRLEVPVGFPRVLSSDHTLICHQINILFKTLDQFPAPHAHPHTPPQPLPRVLGGPPMPRQEISHSLVVGACTGAFTLTASLAMSSRHSEGHRTTCLFPCAFPVVGMALWEDTDPC